ncbi:MAG: sulfite exporter TauE/SafE family protein, partial [Clostridiales bacterium]|nr:sulfite exporter TauE/SafE family protein [Clostridiales bacterium]
MLRNFLVCLVAGAAAGVGTGFAGLSAATVISPMLIAFLGCPWYESVAIGLASDVLASAFSAVIYKKNGHMDLKNGVFMLISVLVMTVVGSFFSQFLPDLEMGFISIIATALMGIRFVVWPAVKQREGIMQQGVAVRRIMSIVCGAFIGFYCGFMGVGGGMMMLFILTIVLGYELKTAVGTSVFIMAFTAFTGAASHFYFGEIESYIPELVLCCVFTLTFALISSYFANMMSPI